MFIAVEMDRELLDYYNRELAYLRELGAEFAAAHPQEAARLALEAGRCEDPHVERLLEGFAFLAARIRHKVDDEYPEIAQAFLSVLFPHYQRPIPALTIVQYAPAADPTKMIEGYTIPAGTEMIARPVEDVACRFRSAYPVELWPVAVESAALEPDRVVVEGKPPGAQALLTLGLRCDAPEGWASLRGLRRLRFYLDGQEPAPSTVYELLFAQLCGAWLRGTTADGEPRIRSLPLDAIRPVGFEPDEGLWPYPAQALPGYRLLQEFFAFPQKFFFFEVDGLDHPARAGWSGPVELLLFFRHPPRLAVTVRPESFKLACTPAVNLFPMVAEPIRLDRVRSEYPLAASHRSPQGYEIHSIERVVSVGGFLEDSVTYQPFYRVPHGDDDRRPEAYWIATRVPSIRAGDDGTELRLAFTDLNFRPAVPSAETITAYVQCSNRDVPSRLPFGGGQGDFTVESEGPVSRARYLTRPTATLRPPSGRRVQWRLISSLALNHLSLVNAPEGRPDALRELLTLYDFADTTVTRKMIRGLDGVVSRRVAGRIGSRLGKSLALGLEVELRLDEAAFPGSQAFLLASVLDRFLGSYVTINAFTRTVAVSTQREGAWKQWPPRSGDRTLL